MWAGEIGRQEYGGSGDPYDHAEIARVCNVLRLDTEYHRQTGSTMPIVDSLAATQSPDAVVIADHQTNGIGREGRRWHDKEGSSVLMSALLRLHDPSHIKDLADLVALETCLALRSVTGQDVRIKYPNDLTFHDAKTGGILVRNILDDSDEYLGTNIGIGINVHYEAEELADYPTDPGYTATSLDLIAGTRISRQDVLTEILRRIRYSPENAAIVNTNPNELERRNNQWREVSSLLGRRIAIVTEDSPIEGEAIDSRIGEGILLRDAAGNKSWHNVFDTSMKVRII